MTTSTTTAIDFKNIAGSTIIDFTISNMPAYIYLYPYVNKQKITEYTKPTGGLFGQNIFTNAKGIASGTIVFPSDPTLNLPSGTVEIQFGDSFTSFDSSVNFATTSFFPRRINGFSGYYTRTESLLPSASLTNTDANRTNTAQWMQQKVFNNPLAQVFKINPIEYPNGLFATGVELYLASKDLVKTISIELRPVVNGVPSTTSVISDSLVVKDPSEISIYRNNDIEASLAVLHAGGLRNPTNFIFKKPIHLLPNQEYALCIFSDSNIYSLYKAKLNDIRIDRIRFDQNTYITKWYPGNLRLFQAGDYNNPDINTVIAYGIQIAEFELGTESFTIVSKDTSKTDYYNKYKFNSADKIFSGLTDINYSIKTKSNGTFPASFEPFPSQQLVVLDSNRTANVSGDVLVNVTFTNKSKHISPVLDLEGTDFVVFNDNPLSNSFAVELPASSTYVSKVYKVEEGLDFTGISVELSANKPAGTSLKVYCKLLGAGDLDIENNQWIELPRKADKASEVTDLLSYVKDTYQTLQGLTYTDNSVTYTKFKEFKIRVDFVSTNSAVTPSINKMIIKTV